ncbi:MAG: GIY-YIG nuclease family protein [Veillonellaceae bacterium]|nr:GIY-YIG nuclease family protein [Veillonellaceae bacterium]
MENYFVRCSDGSLYAGIARDAVARVAQHNAGKGAKYTRARRPVRLVWRRRAGSAREARRWEYRLKQLPKEAKEILVGNVPQTAAYRAVIARVRRELATK